MFSAVRIATPDFGPDQIWLSLGNQQIRLQESRVQPLVGQHFGIQVKDMEHTYRQALSYACLDESWLGSSMWRSRDGVATIFLRDPAHNLVAAQFGSWESLPAHLQDKFQEMSDRPRPQAN